MPDGSRRVSQCDVDKVQCRCGMLSGTSAISQGDAAVGQPLLQHSLAFQTLCRHRDECLALSAATLSAAVADTPQGDEAAGRPLLQRALAIQTDRLGPNHEDVIAIREVLEE